MNMREIMARAIAEAIEDRRSGRVKQSWDDLSAPAKGAMFRRADAALDALMEPTEDMSNASTATPQVRDIDWVSALLGTGISSAEDVVLASYRAMIQAARDEDVAP